MRRPALALVVVAISTLAGCSDDNATPTTQAPTTTAPPITGLCTVVSGDDLTVLFTSGVISNIESTDDRCSIEVASPAGIALGTLLLSGSGIPIATARENAIGLGQAVSDVDDLGDDAFFTSNEDQRWIAAGVGDVTYTTSVTYVGEPPPADDPLQQFALGRLAAAYLATL